MKLPSWSLSRKNYTIGETLIKLARMPIVKEMFGEEEVDIINKISLSADKIKK
jgi:hypothetical protein